MSDGSNIGWTDATWPLVRGCNRVSPGCDECYAILVAARFDRPGMWGEGLTKLRNGEPDWSGKIQLVPTELPRPLHWKRPRLVFPCSGADLFHHKVPFEYIAAAYGVMLATPHHTYQTLTKRPDRELQFHEWLAEQADRVYPDINPSRAQASFVLTAARARLDEKDRARLPQSGYAGPEPFMGWPPPNVLAGTSAERQPELDERMASLRKIPAAGQWLSLEPLLGEIDLTEYIHPVSLVRAVAHHERTNHDCGGGGSGADADCTECGAVWEAGKPDVSWVVVGGESGRKHRDVELAWIDQIVQQCRAAKVPIFVKQDSGLRPGKQGRLSDDLWAIKDLPPQLIPADALVRASASERASGRAAALRLPHLD